MAATTPNPTTNARLIHFSLMAGIVLFASVATFVRAAKPVEPLDPVLLYLPFLVAAAGFGSAMVFRGRLPPHPPGAPADEWWQTNLTPALILWALLEAPSLIGVVVFLRTGSAVPLVVTGVGLVLFLLMSPGRLLEG